MPSPTSDLLISNSINALTFMAIDTTFHGNDQFLRCIKTNRQHSFRANPYHHGISTGLRQSGFRRTHGG